MDWSADFHDYLRTKFPTYSTRLDMCVCAQHRLDCGRCLRAVPGIGPIVGVADAIGSAIVLAKEGIDLGTAMADRGMALGDARETRERDPSLTLEQLASSKGAILPSALR